MSFMDILIWNSCLEAWDENPKSPRGGKIGASEVSDVRNRRFLKPGVGVIWKGSRSEATESHLLRHPSPRLRNGFANTRP